MSRISGDYDNSEVWDRFWPHWQERAMTSKASLKRWAQIEAALLALPQPQLCEESLYSYGSVCAVGAVVLSHEAKRAGMGLVEYMHAEEWDEQSADTDEYETAWAGQAAGLPYTLAWALMEVNDETCAGMTDEARYEYVLAWVREKRAAAEALHGGS